MINGFGRWCTCTVDMFSNASIFFTTPFCSTIWKPNLCSTRFPRDTSEQWNLPVYDFHPYEFVSIDVFVWIYRDNVYVRILVYGREKMREKTRRSSKQTFFKCQQLFFGKTCSALLYSSSKGDLEVRITVYDLFISIIRLHRINRSELLYKEKKNEVSLD